MNEVVLKLLAFNVFGIPALQQKIKRPTKKKNPGYGTDDITY